MNRFKSVRSIRAIKSAALAGCATIALMQGQAFAQEMQVEFDIDPQELGAALNEFGLQSGKEIFFIEAETEGKTTSGVEGAYAPDAALKIMLDEAGIDYRVNEMGTVLVGTIATRRSRLSALQQTDIVLAQAQGEAQRKRASGDEDEEKDKGIDEVVVTGSNIRGVAPESSPSFTFDRQDILDSGASTAQQFIQTLPQNFGGGANENFEALPNESSAGRNDGEGSSVNLRGLGSGSTLVLLNGRRVAPSSNIGGFIDISMIPASALERVEVLTDGASSIYGGDAVAGVVNFVLRSDFEGLESSFRYGTVTEGDLSEYRASLTGGINWSSGNALIVYEYLSRDNLNVGDRSFSSGVLQPNDLLPSQERHSVLGSATQEITENLAVGGDILYSKREASRTFTGLSGLIAGATFQNPTVSENLNVGANVSWNISGDWFVDVSGNYSEVENVSKQIDVISNSVLSRLITSSDLWSVDAKASGTLLELPGGPAKLAVGGHYRQESLSNRTPNILLREADREANAFFGEVFIPVFGDNNAVPGIQRLELSVSGRLEDYSDFGSKASPKVGVLWAPTEELRFRGSYSTSFKPPVLGRVGALDSGVNAFPTSFVNSVFGFVPGDPSISDVVFLLVYGTAGDLQPEESRAFTGGFDYNQNWGRHSLKMSSTYFDVEFEGRLNTTPIPDNRSPFDAHNIAFGSPELFPAGSIIFSPTQEQINETLKAFSDFPVFALFGINPLDAEIINSVSIIRNLSRSEVRGIDFDMAYSFDSDIGLFGLGLNGSYLFDSKEQGSATTPIIEQVNTRFHPIDLNLRGRIGFARDDFSANLFVNYADSYHVDSTASALPIGSWTTVDFNFSFDVQERFGDGIFGDTVFRMSVLNLFNEDPPRTPSIPEVRIYGYDPANASPLGRFISFEVTTAF